ncbi:hypothetical protein D9613_001898 [Agrocybe pediades]|uniref:Uncharacterized protein n=1 Tax=Agrocybe pediades TaxID=84607 RepID=A0A8H4R6N5_9AGAR|nr:hypothetical protein D9613_001898 [Agrocybe pediades]
MSAALRRVQLTLHPARWTTRRCLHASPVHFAQTVQDSSSASSQTTEPPNSTVRKARRKAKKSESAPADTPAPTNTVQRHIDRFPDIDPRGSVALEDVERYRVPSRSKKLDPNSSTYEDLFLSTVNNLTQSFTSPQLRQFIELYGSNPPPLRTKAALATYIVEEQWKYPSLEKVRQEKIDWTEQEDIQVPMDPSQSFLLIGKDGTNIFELSKRYGVYLAFTANPMSLRVKGLKGSVKKIQGYLSAFKKDIELSTFYLPVKHRISAETEQVISRLSGAYIKMADDLKISVTFLRNKPETLALAKRLVVEAAAPKPTSVAQAIYLPEESSDTSTVARSLYPFSPLHVLPWQTRTSPVFRYRRVGTTTRSPHLLDAELTEELPSGVGSIFNQHNTKVNLKTLVSDSFAASTSVNNRRTISISPGHILFALKANERSMLPPISGVVGFQELLNWTKNNPTQVQFSPSIPRIVESAAPQKELHVRRVVYQFQGMPQEHNPNPRLTMSLEMPYSQSLTETSPGDWSTQTAYKMEDAAIVLRSTVSIDLLVPDKQVDLRISAESEEKVPPSKWPKELKAFVSRLSSSTPEPEEIPLSITHAENTYLLQSNQRVRRSIRNLALNDVDMDRKEIFSEDAVDLESGENSVVCKLSYEDCENDSDWTALLQSCNGLAASP